MDNTIENKENEKQERHSKVRIWSQIARRLRTRSSSRKVSIAKTTFCENARVFSENTTLHALKYVGDSKLSYFERLFFLGAFIISLTVALNFIYNIYMKWSSTPVIIANSATNTYISQIPFPSITVCNMNQALKSKVVNMDRKSSEYSILQTLCSRREKLEGVNISNRWNDFENFLYDTTQPCSNMLVLCRYASREFNCSTFFKPILTDEGRCCAFNTVDSAFMYKNKTDGFFDAFIPKGYFAIDWTPESGYPKQLPENYYPFPAAGTGYSMGLTLILDAQIHEYFCSSTNGAGFKILLHSPTETPNVGDNGISLQVGHETRLVITPIISEASETLRSIRREERQCLFENEANLSYFRTYSRRNCEMECEARLIAEQCNCILYYMPRISDNITICSVKETQCFLAVNMQTQTSNQDKNNCSVECLSSCFDLDYDSATYSTPIMPGKFDIREQFLEEISVEYAVSNMAVVHFYYLENAFRSKTKGQFVGFTEFLSSTGGLMGLFIGFSIISVIEIIYYASFRPLCASRRYKKSHKKTVSNINAANIRKKFRLPFENILNTFFRKDIASIAEPEAKGWHVRKFKRMQGFSENEKFVYSRQYIP